MIVQHGGLHGHWQMSVPLSQTCTFAFRTSEGSSGGTNGDQCTYPTRTVLWTGINLNLGRPRTNSSSDRAKDHVIVGR